MENCAVLNVSVFVGHMVSVATTRRAATVQRKQPDNMQTVGVAASNETGGWIWPRTTICQPSALSMLSGL